MPGKPAARAARLVQATSGHGARSMSCELSGHHAAYAGPGQRFLEGRADDRHNDGLIRQCSHRCHDNRHRRADSFTPSIIELNMPSRLRSVRPYPDLFPQ